MKFNKGLTESDLLAHADRLRARIGEPGWGLKKAPNHRWVLMKYAQAKSPALSPSDMYLWVEASIKMFHHLQGE